MRETRLTQTGSDALAGALRWLAILAALAAPAAAQRNLAGTAEILLALERIEVTGSVLMIGAHPDDENTALLGWLAILRARFRLSAAGVEFELSRPVQYRYVDHIEKALCRPLSTASGAGEKREGGRRGGGA